MSQTGPNQQMLAHLQVRTIAEPEPLPENFVVVLDEAQRHLLHGQLSLALSTLEPLPDNVGLVASVIILHIRILLKQGYLHRAVQILKDNILLLQHRGHEPKPEKYMLGDEMQKETWELWINLLFWDEEGMSIEDKTRIARKAFNAWKTYLELRQMDTFTELHTLLYEIIHYLGVGTCDLPPREWTANTDALLSSHMDSSNFVSVLAILRVRNYVLGQADPTFSNIMLEYFPNLSDHPDIKFLEARTRLGLYHTYINAGQQELAYQQLAEIDKCLQDAPERENSELKWLVKFYRASAVTDMNRNAKVDSDGKLAKYDALAHEARTHNCPEFQLKALSAIVVILLISERYDDFLRRENELLQQATTCGQPAAFWRAHLRGIPENLPPPEHPRAEKLATDLQTMMDGVDWRHNSEVEGSGPIGVGLGTIVWTGIAEMLVGIQEMWRAKTAVLAHRLVEEEKLSGISIDEGNLSRELRRLLESDRQRV